MKNREFVYTDSEDGVVVLVALKSVAKSFNQIIALVDV